MNKKKNKSGMAVIKEEEYDTPEMGIGAQVRKI